MKTACLLIGCLVLAGCESANPRLQLDTYEDMRFLNSTELAAAQAALPELRFPLTRAETLSRLHLRPMTAGCRL